MTDTTQQTSPADAAWNSLIAGLEFEIAELQHEQNNLNFWQPELISNREAWLARALRARRGGWSVEDWAELEVLVAADEWAAQVERARIELAKDEELERYECQFAQPGDGNQ